MKSWIKGGLIGIGIYALIFILIIVSSNIIKLDPAEGGITRSLYELRGSLLAEPCKTLTGYSGDELFACTIIINPLIWLTIFFIAGALIRRKK
jgi:hypothetical protein